MSLYEPIPNTPGICMRCGFRKNRKELRGDPNSPGLLVCNGCADLPDPYRGPQRAPENLVTIRPSLDEPLDV